MATLYLLFCIQHGRVIAQQWLTGDELEATFTGDELDQLVAGHVERTNLRYELRGFQEVHD